MYKTYCPLPWVHSSLVNGNEVLPCCAYVDNSFTGKNFEKIFYGEQLNTIRKKNVIW